MAAAAPPGGVDITRALLAAQDPDQNVRHQAEQQIAYFQEQNYSGFLGSLAYELANAEKPPESRRLAGIVLKNNLDAKDDARKAALVARWEGVDAPLRANIRAALLSGLAMEPQEVRGTVALVVAKVAAIELPRREWGELIPALLANMSAPPPNHGVRQATLQALGYICEEMGALKDDVLSPEQINMVLTAVVSGMRPEEPAAETRLAAVAALQNAIEFAEHNFSNESERNYIMQARGACLLRPRGAGADGERGGGGGGALCVRCAWHPSRRLPRARADPPPAPPRAPAGRVPGHRRGGCAHPHRLVHVPPRDRGQLLRAAAAVHAGGLQPHGQGDQGGRGGGRAAGARPGFRARRPALARAACAAAGPAPALGSLTKPAPPPPPPPPRP